MRVCLDTNVLVAAFATRGLCADVLRAVLTEHDLIVGEVILADFRRVVKSRLKVPAEHRVRRSSVQHNRDPAETGQTQSTKGSGPGRPLDCCDGSLRHADVLVTGDKDLLAVAGDAPLLIVEPRAFWELLRSGERR